MTTVTFSTVSLHEHGGEGRPDEGPHGPEAVDRDSVQQGLRPGCNNKSLGARMTFFAITPEHAGRVELLALREGDVCVLPACGHTNEEIGK